MAVWPRAQAQISADWPIYSAKQSVTENKFKSRVFTL
jgi:hypothetical protein